MTIKISRPCAGVIGVKADRLKIVVIIVDEVSVIAEDSVGFVIFVPNGKIAPAVSEVKTGSQADAVFPSIVVVRSKTRGHVNFEAFEVLFHDHVDRARDRIRTIDRRATDRYDIYPLDQRRR